MNQTDATRNITYLKAQLEKTPVADMQKVFYQLIEDQTKNTDVDRSESRVRVSKTLDPAVVAEEKSKTQTSLDCCSWYASWWYARCDDSVDSFTLPVVNRNTTVIPIVVVRSWSAFGWWLRVI